MVFFLRQALKVVDESNFLLLLIDARFPLLSRNKLLEKIILRSKKDFAFVVNKIDLVTDEELEKIKRIFSDEKVIFISSTQRQGSKALRLLIDIQAKKSKKTRFVVGVIGYPNTGKSTLINILSGRASARASKQAGFTKGRQLIRLKEGVYLLDSPGVIPFKENDSFNLVLFNAISFNQVHDPVNYALKLIDYCKKNNLAFFKQFDINEDELNSLSNEELVDLIAIKKKLLLKKGLPNSRLASIKLIQKWQEN